MIATESQPTVRLATGQHVRAQSSFMAKPNKPKKLLILIQFYDGDREAAEDLAMLIADMERIRNRSADIMLFGREDAKEFDRGIRTKLETKFDKVLTQRCRRKGARGFPFAPNEHFYDFVTLFAQYPQWRSDYFAFLNLESDCVPMHPGWISELIEAFHTAKVHGFSAVGHLHGNPVDHMNGVAVYDINFWTIVGSGKLSGGNLRIPYDIYHAPVILPHAQDTPYICLAYQKPTISPEDLFRPHKGNVEPALFHGVKDSSARDAVRAKHVTFTDTGATTRRSVFTYFNPANAVGINDNNGVLQLWKEAWSSRGWNPVVLGLREANQNPRYKEVMAAITRFPGFGSDNRAARWLALDTIGGGLMTDYDVLPGNFTPAQTTELKTVQSLDGNEPVLTATAFPRTETSKWIDAILAYDLQPGEEKVTDKTIFDATFPSEDAGIVVPFGSPGWREAKLIHFSNAAVHKFGVRGQTKSRTMEAYLRGE